MLSVDLRQRIVSYALSHSLNQTASVFKVAKKTVILLKKKFIETGNLENRPSTRVYSRLISKEGELYLKDFVNKNPDLTLNEIINHYDEVYQVRVCSATMSNTLKALGFTYKKKYSKTLRNTQKRMKN